MKKHTLSLAIVGTLASSLILSQAVLAEEVVSDKTVAEDTIEQPPSDASNSTTTPENSPNENTENHAKETKASTPSNVIGVKTSFETFSVEYNRATDLSTHNTFFTEESLNSLNNVVKEFETYTQNTDSTLLESATVKISNVFANLKNNYNLNKTVEELTSTEVQETFENTPEAFEYELAKLDVHQTLRALSDIRLFGKEDEVKQYSKLWNTVNLGKDPLPVKEEYTLATNNLKSELTKLKKLFPFAEESQEFKDFQHFIELKQQAEKAAYVRYYSPESADTLKKAFDKSRDVDYHDIEAVRSHSTRLDNALKQLTVIAERKVYHETLSELDKLKHSRAWSKVNEELVETLSTRFPNFSIPEGFDYVTATSNMKAIINHLTSSSDPNPYDSSDPIFGTVSEILGYYQFYNGLTDESSEKLSNLGNRYNNNPLYKSPTTPLKEITNFLSTLDMEYFDSVKADKEVIDLTKDTDITLTVKLKPNVVFSELTVDNIFRYSGFGSIVFNRLSNAIITEVDKGTLTIRIPLPSSIQYQKVFAPHLTVRIPGENDVSSSLPVFIPVKGHTPMMPHHNYLTSTSLDKSEVTHGEHIIFNAQFAVPEYAQYHAFNIYRMGESTPFKTIFATNRHKSVSPSYRAHAFYDEVYSVITITEDFPAGEYEIREGNYLGGGVYFRGGYSLATGEDFIYSVPTKFYQRFTVKAKAQAETEKKEDGKTDEQPKVDNTKPVEDTKTDEQPKVDNPTPEKQPEKQPDNATPEVKPSDNKKDEPSQPENKPSDHKQDNTMPEVKPSVDVKPMDIPTSTKGDEKKDKVKEVKEEKTEVTTPATSAPSAPTATPSKSTSSAQALPETGELDSLFGLSALAILASVGLVAPALRRREQ